MANSAHSQASASPSPFLRVVAQLKETPRRGWEVRGISRPESVSDHMYRMAVMIMLAPGIDEDTRTHALKMALIHDIGEAITGDIVPSDGVPKEEKHCREGLAIRYLSCLAQPVNATFAKEMAGLWNEYERGNSNAAKLVHSVDALECMDQAIIYEERSRCNLKLGEFMELQSKVAVPQLEGWVTHLKQERADLWSPKRASIVVLFVIGGPGVGKGTQCAILAHELDGMHISVGDLIREEAKVHASAFAGFINDSLQHSVIVPADLTIRLLKRRIHEGQDRGTRIFIIDGFPRSLDQAHSFEEKIHASNNTILLDCSEAVMRERLSMRSQQSVRIDDNATSILKRLRAFSEVNVKVEEHLQQTGPFWKIDATGSVEEISHTINAVMKQLL